MDTNTENIINNFVKLVDTDNDYTLAELTKLLKDAYIGNDKHKETNKKKEKNEEVEDEEPKKKKNEEEPKKKREPSAYNKYVKAKVPMLKEENPETPAKELMTMAAKLWKELSEEEKAKYK